MPHENAEGLRAAVCVIDNLAGINKPKYCWCRKGIRPSVPCHHIREYRYAYGAVEPLIGDSCFLIMPYCNTVCMNLFLEQLSASYPDDYIVLICDGAAWHKSGTLKVFRNIELMFIPPYTPEMNPVEQIWKELRARGFHNEIFQTLGKLWIGFATPSAIYPPILFAASSGVAGLLDVVIRD